MLVPYSIYDWNASASLVWYVKISRAILGVWEDGTAYHIYSCGLLPHTNRQTFVRYIENRMTKGSIGPATSAVDAKKNGGVAAVGTFDFSIVDSGDWMQSLYDADISYERRPVGLYVSYVTSQDGSPEDMLVWSGFVKEIERNILNDSVRFMCETSDSSYSKQCPPNSWGTSTDMTDPQGGKAEPKQLVFGEHEMVPALMMGPATDLTGVEIGGSHGPSYAIGDYGLGAGFKAIIGCAFGDEGLIAATGGLANIVGGFTSYLELGRAVLSYQPESKLRIMFDVNITSYQTGGRYAITGVNWFPIIDADSTTNVVVNNERMDYYTGLDPYVGHNACWAVHAKLPYIGLSGDIPKISSAVQFPKVYLGYSTKFTNTYPIDSFYDFYTMSASISFGRDRNEPVYGNSHPTLPFSFPARPFTDVVNAASHTAETDYFNARAAVFGTGVDVPLETLGDLSGGLIYISVSWHVDDPATAYISRMRVYAISGIRVYADVDYPSISGIFVDAQGYKDAASGTYVISGVPNQLLTNPSHIAAWIEMYCSNAGLSNVNITSFRSVASQLPAWEFAAVVNERTTVESVVSQVAEAAGFYIWCDSTGKMRAFSAATAGATTFVLGLNIVVGGTLVSAKETPLEDVCFDFKFHFRFNPVSGLYDDSLVVNSATQSSGMEAGLTTLCQQAIQRFGGSISPRTIETDWIRSRATACLWAAKYVREHTSRHWIIVFDVDANMCRIEPGDTFTFEPGPWIGVAAIFRTSQYVVTGTAISPSDNTSRITAVQTR